MVSLAVVGLGQWGKNHARVALQLLKEGQLDQVILCDTDRRRLQGYPKDAETSDDPSRVTQPDVDAVDIVTPAESHFALAGEFLAAGKHVFVEKPMAMHAGEARALLEIAGQKGLTLMPGHIFRYHPGVQEVRTRIQRGFFGEIRYLGTIRTAFVEPRPDVGVLFSLGIHEADLYPYLLGEEYPEMARADTAAFLDPSIDEVASMFFRFNGGRVGFAFESWISPGRTKERKLTVVGTDRTAEIDYLHPETMTIHESKMIRDSDAGWRFEEGESHTVRVDTREPLREEMEDFIRAVGGGGKYKPRADAACGYRAVEIIEALKVSGSYVPPHGTSRKAIPIA